MAPLSRSPTDPRDTLSPHHLPHHRARFPSLTEFPDSPSVYSHAYHSPDSDVLSDTASFSRLSDSSSRPQFDDETASTIRSFSTEDIRDESDIEDFTDDASHRISLGGPKIRFHSRAPWETDDEVPDKNPGSGTTGNKLKGKASKADSLIRTFTRGSHITSRPSVDSARSQTSFEATTGNHSNSRGVLYDLARQSASNSSLVSCSTSVRSQDFARATNYPKSSYYQIHDSLARAVSLDGMVPRATTVESVPIRPSSSGISRVGHERSTKPSPALLSQERQLHDQFVHPYANPDLVVAYTPSLEIIPSHYPISGDMSGSDSRGTVTDSTSTRSAAFPVISTDTSTTSLASRDIPHGNRRVGGKDISSPISVIHENDAGYVDRSTRFLSLHPPPVGFEGPHGNNPRSPTVTLITLQEAQARERFRNNTIHTSTARSKLPFPGSDDILEVAEDQTAEGDMGGDLALTRVRSTSAGARYKSVPLPSIQSHGPEIRGESPVTTPVSAVPGRTLKHKKSGFLRLFGGRNSEGEKEKNPPPPVPPLGDVYTEESLQIHGNGKTLKTTLSSVPKSSFSPTLSRTRTSNTTLASTHSASGGDGPDGKGLSSRRKHPPPLSIVTKTSDRSLATSISGKRSPMGMNFTPPPPLSLAVPQSAPPSNSDFPGLKLRPVSTSFSSHFADMVTNTKKELQHEIYSPSSAASSGVALSPFTPISVRRSDDVSATVVETLGEEYLTIQGLQDQLASAKQQPWELRGQIRDLTSELEDLRAVDNQEYCEICGRGERKRHISEEQQRKKVGVVNRPRARTGDAARFASGN